MPTCGLALTEAERVRDGIVAAIEARLRGYGLERERLSVRITGYTNGCARPTPETSALSAACPVSTVCTSAATSLDAIAETLDPLFELFASARIAGEGVGDFCRRIGLLAMQQVLAERHPGAA
jgi:sulfite reductase (ferredoxin)